MAANEQYDQPYVAGSTPAYAATGNWLLYSAASSPPPFTKPPVVIITEVQKPPLERPIFTKKPLPDGCGGESLIMTSASSIFERFTDTENDSCGLDLLLDEPTVDGKNNCPVDKSQHSTKEKTEKL